MVPFPFLFICFVFTLIVIAGWIKDWWWSLIMANLSAFYGLIELMLFFIYFVSAFIIGKWIIGLIVLVSFFSYIACNIWMYVIWKKRVRKDLEFQNWWWKYRKTAFALPLIGLVVSFRAFKFFYSGLFGL